MLNSLQSSRWNIFLPLKNDMYLLFNTNSRIILAIDEEFKNTLEDNKITNLDDDTIQQLLKLGAITNSDELQKYKMEYNSEQYGSAHSTFVLFPTYGCNLACDYCYQRKANTPMKSMSSEMIKKTLHFIKQRTMKDRSRHLMLKFFGGEPLVRPDIVLEISKSLQEWCNENNVEYFGTLTTNGTLLSGEIFESLTPFLKAVHITMDGEEKFHNSKRFYKKDGSGTYNDIIKALELLKEKKIYTTLRVNIHEENLHGLRKLLEDFSKRDFNENKFLDLDFGLVLPEHSTGCEFDQEYYITTKKKVVEFSKVLNPVINEFGWEKIARIRLPDDIHSEKIPVLCDHTKRKRYIIDSNGDLYLCPSRSGEKSYRVGVLDDRGNAVFNEKYYQIINRSPWEFDECLDCPYLPLCGSGCAIHTFEASGIYNTNFCGAIKEITPQRVKSFVQRTYTDKYEFL